MPIISINRPEMEKPRPVPPKCRVVEVPPEQKVRRTVSVCRGDANASMADRKVQRELIIGILRRQFHAQDNFACFGEFDGFARQVQDHPP
jgi:hypothetical protein